MSTITFSGFNQIDFNTILKAVMEQERQPLVALQNRRTVLESQREAFATLATRLASLESAAGGLADATALNARTTTVSDETAVAISGGSSAPAGTYDVVVNSLARAQVTASSTTYADRDVTPIAIGGTLVIGGVPVLVPGATTLQGLADAINSTPGVGVTATIVAAAGQHRLVLTGKATGAAGAFTVTSELTGGSGLAFDGNAVEASDADVLVNNVRVTSATNTLDGAIPGATLTLRKQAATPVTVTIGRDVSSVGNALQSFIGAYNDLVKFLDEQNASAAQGQTASIARDAVTRSLRAALREGLNRRFDSGGALQYLSQIGVRFEKTGELSLDKTALERAAVDLPGLEAFVAGTGATGAFDAIRSIVREYVRGDGLVPSARTRLSDEMQRLDDRIAGMEARLAVRQTALQREYAAADQVMTQLSSQLSALSSIGTQYQSF